MNKLQLPSAKLLYAVGQAYRKRMIDETQKKFLKEQIMIDNAEIYQLLKQVENQTELQEKLIAFIRAPQPEKAGNIQSEDMITMNKAQEEEPSSPWGQFLRRKKRKIHFDHHSEVHELKNLIQPHQTE